jgi:drug/metabolite transporter (DMT)-like permease
MKRFRQITSAFSDNVAMKQVLLGSFFGPAIGVSLSLYAIQHSNTGIATALMSLVPILIIFPSVVLYKQAITKGEIFGAVIAFSGVVLFFI